MGSPGTPRSHILPFLEDTALFLDPVKSKMKRKWEKEMYANYYLWESGVFCFFLINTTVFENIFHIPDYRMIRNSDIEQTHVQ